MINLKYIKSLNPCQDRLKNYIKHYRNFSGTLKEFLNLEKITHADKISIFFRSIPKNLIPLVAADIAESVLHLYENAYPGNLRPREAIAAARSGNAASAAYAIYTAHAASYALDAIDAAEQELVQLQIMKRSG